jgi:hypothetical protein
MSSISKNMSKAKYGKELPARKVVEIFVALDTNKLKACYNIYKFNQIIN